MKIERLAHVGITVRELPAALEFYVAVLGFTIAADRPDFAFDGAWLDSPQGQVHLIVTPATPPGPANHLALQVDDLDEWTAHLDTLEITYRHLTYFPAAGRQIFVQDPSGNTIELNQPTPTGATP